jgi:hypothetical protein
VTMFAAHFITAADESTGSRPPPGTRPPTGRRRSSAAT